MREAILDALKGFEPEYGCRILFACEAGSRAWGFASPDSDYDVRFIYAHPVEWHLRLEARRDTIERALPGDLDVAGWELAKALRLFAGCNPGMNEWLDSPEVYFADPDFFAAMKSAMPEYFNPKKTAFHYYSIAKGTAQKELQGRTVKIKKAFYILRPLLACQWIFNTQTMPPTPFRRLLEQDLPQNLRAEIDELLARKAGAVEAEKIDLGDSMAQWIEEFFNQAQERAEALPAEKNGDIRSLNPLMHRFSPQA